MFYFRAAKEKVKAAKAVKKAEKTKVSYFFFLFYINYMKWFSLIILLQVDKKAQAPKQKAAKPVKTAAPRVGGKR